MNELKVLANVTPGVITFNAEELKENVKKQLEELKGATFDEDSITVAKALVAQLRSKVKEANAEAIRIDKIYSQPCTDFRAEIKSVNAIIEAAIDEITSQLDVYEEKRVLKKREDVKAIYEKSIDVFGEYLPLDKIYSPQWDNKTFTLAKVTEELDNLIDSVAQAINTISSMNSDSIPKALEMYKADLSITNAITYINNYEKQKAEIEQKAAEQKKIDEENRIREEERKKIADELRVQGEIRQAEERIKAEALAVIEQEKEKAAQEALANAEREKTEALAIKSTSTDTNEYLFAITATTEEVEQIEMYLDSIGVIYSRQ